MAKKRQMRWSDEGAHLLVQVRVHVINGELKPRALDAQSWFERAIASVRSRYG